MKHVLRFFAAALAVMLLVAMLAGCAKASEKPKFSSVHDFNDAGFVIGATAGTGAEIAVQKLLPNAQIKYYTSTNDGYLALQQGKIDAYAYERDQMAISLEKQGMESLCLLPDNLGEDVQVSVGLSRATKVPDLEEHINAFLAQLRADGTLKDMYKRWAVDKNYEMPDIELPKNPTTKIVVGTSGIVEPFSFYIGETITGYDIEMAKLFAVYMNAEVELRVANYDGLLSAAESGVIDCIMANLYATKEQRNQVDFSDPIYLSQSTFMVQKARVAGDLFSGETAEIDVLQNLSGKTVGILTGSVFDLLLNQSVEGIQYQYFSSNADQIIALENSQIDGMVMDLPVAEIVLQSHNTLALLPECAKQTDYSFGLAKNSPLTAQINEKIAILHAEGFLDEIYQKWTAADADDQTVADYPCEGTNGTLRVAYDNAAVPMAYMRASGEACGFEVEALCRIAQMLNMKIELVGTSFDALAAQLSSGKVDVVAACLIRNKERLTTMDMTDTTFAGGVYVLVRKTQAEIAQLEQVGFFEGLKASFVRTFITENRWKLVLNGLVTTVLISIFAGILGSALGFGICMLRRSGSRVVSRLMAALIRVVQGTPIVVLLMILYYILFARVDLSATVVAIIGFSINFGVYVSEMMRTGIEAVDKGQVEAARAIGFSRASTFWKITFPQAARHFLPVFKGEFISMVKMTSVVGYIAIQDLTKASDIIRSRTMEAFFPLIATALIYFLVANLLTMVLSRIELNLDPKRRARTVKGVHLQ